MNASISVVFSHNMVAPAQGYVSPSAAKPAQVVADWQQAGLPLRLTEPTAATLGELCLAHSRNFVDSVMTLRQPNGFGTTCPNVARSLPYTTGAMLTAARLAVAGEPIVAAPCSGFHHASWDRASGFCTFNGLAVTALRLLEEGSASRVGILDCDMHWGDGTDAILRRLGRPRSIVHFSAGEKYFQPQQVPEFFKELTAILSGMAGCDVVLYQAGADPHIDDPLGGWMTTRQMAMRDRMVFTALRDLGVPVVWNLAGGYQRDAGGSIEPVLQIHRNTAREHARALSFNANGGDENLAGDAV